MSHKPAYKLKDIKALAANINNVRINSNAEGDARYLFGFGPEDTLQCYQKLRASGFISSNPHKKWPDVMVDSYRVVFQGENIYTHFYVDIKGKLVINSFKEDNRGQR